MLAFCLLVLFGYFGITSCTEDDSFYITILSIQYNTDEHQLLIQITTRINSPAFKLRDPRIVATPNINSDNLQFTIASDNGDECVINPDQSTSSRCYQIYTMYGSNPTNDILCPIELDGAFMLEFTLDNTPVSFLLDIAYQNAACDASLFEADIDVAFIPYMSLYEDAAFEHEMGLDDLYDPLDTCYVQIEIELPSLYDAIELENVWLCTSPPLYNELFSAEAQGCFASAVDEGGPYWVIKNHGTEPSELSGTIIDEMYDAEYEESIIRFSFTIPEVSRDTLHIHTQFSLLNDQHETARIVSVYDAIKLRYFFGVEEEPKNTHTAHDRDLWMTRLEAITVLLIVLSCALMCTVQCCRNQNMKYYAQQRHRAVSAQKHVHVDSSDDSDKGPTENAHLIDNQEHDNDEDFADLEPDHNDPLDESG